MSSQPPNSQDVLKRLKSVQLLALNLGVPKRTIDPWKEEIESHLVKLSMNSPDQSFEGWDKVEESLKEMQDLLKGDRTILDENGNLSENWRTSTLFNSYEKTKTSPKFDHRVRPSLGPRRSRSETINDSWTNVPRSPVESPASAKSDGGVESKRFFH